MRSYLAAYQPVSASTEDDLARMARAAWHKRAYLVASAEDDRLDDTDRLMVRALGTKLYGRRAGA